VKSVGLSLSGVSGVNAPFLHKMKGVRRQKTLKKYRPKPIDEGNHTKLQDDTKCVEKYHSLQLTLRSGRARLVFA
jgi:hypothetical protein